MCRSVYLLRSAVMPTISGRSFASSTSAWPNGADLVRCPSDASEAIIAEVVSRGLDGSPAFAVAAALAPPRHGPRFVRLMAASRRRALPAPASIRAAPPAGSAISRAASRNGTPLAIWVSQMITRGLGSSRLRAVSKARTTASMSLPSTRCACQPNASHFGSSGSELRTPSGLPSACIRFTSTRQIRLASFQWPADIAASQVGPSPSSPSDMRL